MLSALRRLGIVVLATVAILAGWWVGPHAQPAPARFVIVPGAEAPDAVRRGAPDVKAAQALARKKKLAEAVALLEKVAATHPAATHDCNLALAYLRAGQLTRAQLMWDVSRQRGKAPPDWCDSDLAGQLATALRDGGYVPLTLNVSPAGAEVEIGGTRLRDLGLIWVPPGPHTVDVRAPGMESQSLTVMVAPPSARASVTLEPPRVALPPDAAEPPPVDAAVAVDLGSGEADAAMTTVLPTDAGPIAPPPAAMPRWPVFAGVGVGGLGFGVGLAFHMRALGTKDRANQLVAGSPMFDDAHDRFGTERAAAIGGYVVGAAAFGFAAWYWLRREQADDRPAITVAPAERGAGAVITIG